MFDVKGKVALVTGAAKGIGFSIAKELLKNGAMGVALLDVDDESGKIAVEELRKEFSQSSVIYIHTDVGQKKEFEDAFELTIKTFKQIDIVVNNAGHVQEPEPEKCINVNMQGCVTGSLLAIDKYFPQTLGTNQGVILNVSSIFGLSPDQYTPVYSATKQGILGFSKAISGPKRCRDLNLKVLTICPGLTATSLTKLTSKHLQEEFMGPFYKSVENMAKQTSDQLAQHVVPIIRNGITGSVWVINGNKSWEINFPPVFEL